MAQNKPQKIYVFFIVVTKDNKNKECVLDSQKHDEESAIQEYFKLEKKCNDLKDKSLNAQLLFEVHNLKDSSLNILEKYNFFSKIQFEKDKQRLSFND